MLQRWFVGVAAIGVALSMSPSAGAQESKPIGLSIRAGIFMPSQSEARDEGKNWIGGGLEFKLRDLGFGIADPGASTSLTASVDFMGMGPFQHIPVMVNYVGRRNEVYWTVGAGIGFVRDEEITSIGPPAIRESRNSTALAYQFGLGYDFQRGRNAVFVEARYIGSGKSVVNGLGLFVGMRL